MSEEMKETEEGGMRKHVVLEVLGYNAPLAQQRPAEEEEPEEASIVDPYSDPCGRELDIVAAKKIVYDNKFIRSKFETE